MPLKKGIQDHKEQKQRLVEKNKKPYCLESVNSRTTFETLTNSNKWRAKKDGASITGHN